MAVPGSKFQVQGCRSVQSARLRYPHRGNYHLEPSDNLEPGTRNFEPKPIRRFLVQSSGFKVAGRFKVRVCVSLIVATITWNRAITLNLEPGTLNLNQYGGPGSKFRVQGCRSVQSARLR